MAQQIINERLGVNSFPNVERRRRNNEIGPIPLILTAPDQLRIKIGIARIAHLLGVLLVIVQHRLIFSSGNILALGVVVGKLLNFLAMIMLSDPQPSVPQPQSSC